MTPDRLSRISINVLLAITLITVFFKLPPALMIVFAAVAGALKLIDLYGKTFEPSDALIFTELGVTMVEGISRKAEYYTATTAHTFLYEQIRDFRANAEEITFQTVNGLRFSFLPTRKTALTVPDTKWFKKEVYSTAHVVVQFQSR